MPISSSFRTERSVIRGSERKPNRTAAKAEGDRSNEIEEDNEKSWRKPVDAEIKMKQKEEKGNVDNNSEAQRKKPEKK